MSKLKKVLSTVEGYSLELPEDIDTIGYGALAHSKIKKIKLPDNLKTIESASFLASELEEIEVPEKTSQIGDYSFKDCNNLSKIKLNNKNTSLGKNSISSNYINSGVFQINLKDEIPENILSNKSIPINIIISNDFAQSDLDKYKGYKIKKIIIKDTVTKILDAINFGNLNPSCIEVNLNNLTYIGSAVFKNKTLLLTNDTFVVDKQIIKNNAFEGCKGLKKIALKNNENIGDYVFSGSSVEEVFLNDNITTLNVGIFEKCYNLKKINLSNIEELRTKALFDIGIDGNDIIKQIKQTAIIGYSAITTPTLYIPENFEGTFADGALIWTNTVINNSSSVKGLKKIFYSAFQLSNAPRYFSGLGDYHIRFFYGKGSEETFSFVSSSYVSSVVKLSLKNNVFVTSNTEKNFANFVICPLDKDQDNIVISNDVEGIYNNAFENCNNLKTVIIPDNIQQIYLRAFANCINLTEIIFPKHLKYIVASNSTILSQICLNCSELITVQLPKTFTTIKYGSNDPKATINAAFTNCVKLKKVIMPQELIYLDNCFEECKNLKELKFFNSAIIDKIEYVEKIEMIAGLLSINNPNTDWKCKVYLSDEQINLNGLPTYNSFEDYFYYSNNSRNLLQDNKIISLNSTFSDDTFIYADEEKTNLCGIIKINASDELTIPSNIKVISSYAFYNCNNIRKIIIPDTVEEIQEYAFANCGAEEMDFSKSKLTILSNYICYRMKNLKKVILPNKLNNLGAHAFGYCYKLERINLPESIEKLNSTYPFDNSGLKSVYLKATQDFTALYGSLYLKSLKEIYIDVGQLNKISLKQCFSNEYNSQLINLKLRQKINESYSDLTWSNSMIHVDDSLTTNILPKFALKQNYCGIGIKNGEYINGLDEGCYFINGQMVPNIYDNKYYLNNTWQSNYTNKYTFNDGAGNIQSFYFINGELAPTGIYNEEYYVNGIAYTGIYENKNYKNGALINTTIS